MYTYHEKKEGIFITKFSIESVQSFLYKNNELLHHLEIQQIHY